MCIVTAPQNYAGGWSQKSKSSILVPKYAKYDSPFCSNWWGRGGGCRMVRTPVLTDAIKNKLESLGKSGKLPRSRKIREGLEIR